MKDDALLLLLLHELQLLLLELDCEHIIKFIRHMKNRVGRRYGGRQHAVNRVEGKGQRERERESTASQQEGCHEELERHANETTIYLHCSCSLGCGAARTEVMAPLEQAPLVGAAPLVQAPRVGAAPLVLAPRVGAAPLALTPWVGGAASALAASALR